MAWSDVPTPRMDAAHAVRDRPLEWETLIQAKAATPLLRPRSSCSAPMTSWNSTLISSSAMTCR